MRLSLIIENFKNQVRHIQINYRDWQTIRKLKIPPLTRKEFFEIKQTWPCFKFRKLDLGWSRAYKMKKGFSPYFLNDVQYLQLLNHINPYNQVVALQNKAMCDVYFPEIPFPMVYARCLNGNYFDSAMNDISFDEVCELLMQEESFVIKPSVGSMCGAGVTRVMTQDNTIEGIKKVVKNAGNNFIAQEVLHQHSDISKLNETSINCCRVTTIWINGRFDHSTVLKIGKKGSHIDNWSSAYWTGIKKDGTIEDIGYDYNLNETRTTDSGIAFGGIKYPNYKVMIDLLECMHKKYFANCGVVGWDVFIDSINMPKVIEANLWFSGIRGAQLCCGCFFESFRDDICKIMANEEY